MRLRPGMMVNRTGMFALTNIELRGGAAQPFMLATAAAVESSCQSLTDGVSAVSRHLVPI